MEDEKLRVVMQGGEEEKASDFANYFCSYASLYHQKQMLTDHRRMKAYYDSIMSNKSKFKGKVVLDVGTGSGILSLWCAKAGAKKVYAVEYTDMAKLAKKLLTANGVDHIVEVIQSSVEDLKINEAVDIIISEWMGYFLLRESMLDSVIKARDKWLKPDGIMLPSHATMYLGLVSDEEDRLYKASEYIQSTQEWHRFKKEMSKMYQCDMSVLEGVYKTEQKEYYILSTFWAELNPDQCIGKPYEVKHLDLQTCTMQDVQGLEEKSFRIPVDRDCTISGFYGYFTTDFIGSEKNKLDKFFTLSTAPENGYTHWGQQVFYLEVPHWVPLGGAICGSIKMERQKENIRLYNIIMKHQQIDSEEERTPTNMHQDTYLMP